MTDTVDEELEKALNEWIRMTTHAAIGSVDSTDQQRWNDLTFYLSNMLRSSGTLTPEEARKAAFWLDECGEGSPENLKLVAKLRRISGGA